MQFRPTSLPFLLTFAGLALAGPLGCDRDKQDDSIRAYDAPKDPPKVARAVADNSSAQQPAQTSAAEIAWTLPDGWKQLPGAGMRYASIAVSDVDPDLQISVM